MPKFKAVLWEQVTVWQQIKVVVSADSEEDLAQKIKTDSFTLEDCYDADPDWNTEAHLGYDPSNFEILDKWEDLNA